VCSRSVRVRGSADSLSLILGRHTWRASEGASSDARPSKGWRSRNSRSDRSARLGSSSSDAQHTERRRAALAASPPIHPLLSPRPALAQPDSDPRLLPGPAGSRSTSPTTKQSIWTRLARQAYRAGQDHLDATREVAQTGFFRLFRSLPRPTRPARPRRRQSGKGLKVAELAATSWLQRASCNELAATSRSASPRKAAPPTSGYFSEEARADLVQGKGRRPRTEGMEGGRAICSLVANARRQDR
jgi:hypothetical protein